MTEEVLTSEITPSVTAEQEEPAPTANTPKPAATTVTVTETPALLGDELIAVCRESFPEYSEKMMGITSSWEQELSKMILTLPFTAPPIFYEISVNDLANFPPDRFITLRAEAQAVEAPQCLTEHHQLYMVGMDTIIEALQAIENGDLIESGENPFVAGEQEMFTLVWVIASLASYEEWSADLLDEFSVDTAVAALQEMAFFNFEGYGPFFLYSGRAQPVDVVEFTPDGRRFVTFSEDEYTLWDSGSGEQILSIVNSPTSQCSMSYHATSRDGNYLATSGCSGICVWDTESGALAGEISSDLCFYSPELIFSPDSTSLMVAPGRVGENARLYDVVSGLVSLELPQSDFLDEWAFSPTGKQIVALDSHSALVWDATTGDKSMTLGEPSQGALAYLEGPEQAAFGPNGAVIITAGCNVYGSGRCDEGFVRIWDAQSGEILHEMLGHESTVTGIDISGDGKVLATVGEDNVAILWDLESGEALMNLQHDHIPPVGPLEGYAGLLKAEIGSNDQFLLTHSASAMATIWDLEEGRILHTYKGIGSATFSPDGNSILMSNLRGQVALVDPQTGNVVWEMRMPDGK